MLYDEATEEWYAPHDPDEVGRESMRLARPFYHRVEEYRVRFFTYVLFQSAAAHLESYLLHVYYTSELDNDDDKEIGVDQLELDW